MPDWSHDLVLGALQHLDEPIGSLVREYPGRAALADHPDWIESWFIKLARSYAKGEGPDPATITASAAQKGDLSLLAKRPIDASVRLLSLLPCFFRGFREVPQPINFDADLVVVEGRNSSGKTSLSEAVEWVFTGQLSRRTSGEHGHPSELAGCIANEFCPPDAHPSVELTLAVNGDKLVLKRVLKRDYSSTASDSPDSDLYSNGRVLTADEERALRDKLLAGVHPLLMQHNLRRFVHDDPNARRQYFERLLQIDELTGLIERAVVGPTRLSQITNPNGGAGLAALHTLITEIERAPFAGSIDVCGRLRRLDRATSETVPDLLTAVMVEVAGLAFSNEVAGATGLVECRDRIVEAQRAQREARLPLLSVLDAARLQPVPSLDELTTELTALAAATTALSTARGAVSTITEAQRRIASAADSLVAAGLIDPGAATPQICPVCESEPATLAPERVGQLISWAPLTSALDAATLAADSAQRTVLEGLDRLVAAARRCVPAPVDDAVAERQLATASQRVAALATAAMGSARGLADHVDEIGYTVQQIATLVRDRHASLNHSDQVLLDAQRSLEAFGRAVAAHREDVAHLEEAVGAASRDDTVYRLRERWLELAGLVTGVADDVAWEAAKAKAKAALDHLREGLVALRAEIIEDARRTFSDEMTSIWHLLRSDSGAQFSRIHIPPARGRGYKLELELKAVISDGVSEPEVDALRVFSESQVNAVGIAAYVTRAKLLGHKLLILDDPVQSMDEEHFRSFAAQLLPALLSEGSQVIIFTHSDTFARRLHDIHYPRESFATLETRASRRKGCYVQEGSRRVSERLKNARQLAEDGDLPGAWRLIRLVIERMYTLAKAQEDSSFDPESWRNLSAEDMWNKGIHDIVADRAPGAGNRLREILSATVAGAHDKAATSETDVVEAAKYLAALLNPLRLGAG